MLARADAFEQKLSGVNRSLGTLGPDPTSVGQQMLAALTELQNQFGTTAEKIARGFTSVVGSAVDGVAESLSGLIQGTMDWGDALRNVARTMGTAVVNAITRMFAEWLVGRALMAAKNMFFSTQEGAVDAAAKAPGALMSSISSFGVAAAVGVAALLAAIAALGGAFAEGGLVRGPGGPKSDSVLARLSAGEYVVNAEAVRTYGQPLLDRLNRRSLRVSAGEDGAVTPARAPRAVETGPAGGSQAALNLVLVDSRREARQFLESAEGEARIVDIIRRHRMRVGIPT